MTIVARHGHKDSRVPEEKWERLELSFYHQMLGYILGVADAEGGKEFCIPVGTKVEDLVVPVMKVARASALMMRAPWRCQGGDQAINVASVVRTCLGQTMKVEVALLGIATRWWRAHCG